MRKIKLTNTPADLGQIRKLLESGEIDSDQALELLRQLRQSQTPPANDRRKSNG
jgi:hypothetical protein